MKLGRVIGTLVASVKAPGTEGLKLLIAAGTSLQRLSGHVTVRSVATSLDTAPPP